MLSPTQIESINKVYTIVSTKFTPDQIAVLSTMLNRLDRENSTKELIANEKIKNDGYDHRQSWKKEKYGSSGKIQTTKPYPTGGHQS